MKEYLTIIKPNSFWGNLNRTIEFLLEAILVGIASYIISFINLDGDGFIIKSFNDFFSYYSILFLIYFVFKHHRTFTIVNKICVDFKNREVDINYHFMHLIPCNRKISFSDINFKLTNGVSINRTYKVLNIYKAGKMTVKIISRQNGWNEEKFGEAYAIFRQIGNAGNASNELVE
jgi:hypothetical protein